VVVLDKLNPDLSRLFIWSGVGEVRPPNPGSGGDVQMPRLCPFCSSTGTLPRILAPPRSRLSLWLAPRVEHGGGRGMATV
jgi:hypothetical protein